MLPQQCLVILILLLINVIMFQQFDLIEMRSIQTDHLPSPQSSSLAQTNEIQNKMNTNTLTQTLETIQTLLSSSHKNMLLSSGKNKIPTRERNRLIRMVHRVVQLANEVLDLNFTDLSQTTNNQSGNEISPSGTTIHHDDINKNNNITKAKRNSENPVVGQLIPVDLFKPCEQSDIVTIHSMNNEQDDNPTTEIDTSLEDYELPEFEYESRSIIRQSALTGKFKMGFDLLQEMIFKVNSLKGLVTDMIRKNLMKNCLILKVPPIFKMPNSSSQQNISYTLATIYQSLANQTAHLYFIWAEQKNKQQQQQHSDRLSEGGCAKHKRFELIVPDTMDQQNRSKLYTKEGLQWFIPGIENNNDEKTQLNLIIDDFFVVSNNLRSLLCNLGQAIQLFNIPVPTVEITQQVLQHRIRVNRGSSCARRSIFECQLMRDAVRFFGDFEDFLRKESHRFLSIPTAAAATTITTNTNRNPAIKHPHYLFDQKQHRRQHAR